jgi:hypothetical protein
MTPAPLSALLALLFVALTPTQTHARSRREMQRRRREDNPVEINDQVHHVLGAKIIVLGESVEQERTAFIGPGLIYELTAIPHWLELELAAATLFSSEETKIPIDVMLKKPFRISRIVDLFAGAGPMLNLAIRDDKTHVHPGLIVSTGVFLWLQDNFGLLFELDYAFVVEHDGAHEVEAAVGVATRFR